MKLDFAESHHPMLTGVRGALRRSVLSVVPTRKATTVDVIVMTLYGMLKSGVGSSTSKGSVNNVVVKPGDRTS
ncbi:hypothetical protein PsorP6_010769 [Peronosclerospora sorghi]|uniref:Uncharacterized protein n=1 Tax=Peronosclerospora sorghi TaxID=230839 RepID=A0ACC0VVN9_9STRA|nr:hypothetical protein PsorP6_010769 [Peronosclerospora sorghi]